MLQRIVERPKSTYVYNASVRRLKSWHVQFLSVTRYTFPVVPIIFPLYPLDKSVFTFKFCSTARLIRSCCGGAWWIESSNGRNIRSLSRAFFTVFSLDFRNNTNNRMSNTINIIIRSSPLSVQVYKYAYKVSDRPWTCHTGTFPGHTRLLPGRPAPSSWRNTSFHFRSERKYLLPSPGEVFLSGPAAGGLHRPTGETALRRVLFSFAISSIYGSFQAHTARKTTTPPTITFKIIIPFLLFITSILYNSQKL